MQHIKIKLNITLLVSLITFNLTASPNYLQQREFETLQHSKELRIKNNLKKDLNRNMGNVLMESGSSTVEVSLNIPVYKGELFLINKKGLLVASQEVDSSTSKSIFKNVPADLYSLYLTGLEKECETYSKIVSVLGSDDTLITEGHYVEVDNNETINIELLSSKRITPFRTIDTLYFKGKLSIKDDNVTEAINVGLTYFDGVENNSKRVTTDNNGNFLFSVEVLGDSIIAFWGKSSTSKQDWANVWIDGKAFSDEPTVYTKSDGDTIEVKPVLEIGGTLVCKLTNTTEDQKSKRDYRLLLVDTLGHLISQQYVTDTTNAPEFYSFNSVPQGQYYIVVHNNYDPKKDHFYPYGTHEIDEAQLYSVVSAQIDTIDLEIAATDFSLTDGNIVTLTAKFKKQDGTILSGEYVDIRPVGSYLNCSKQGYTDSTANFSIALVDSFSLIGYMDDAVSVGHAWCGGSSKESATQFTVDSNMQHYDVEFTLPEGGSLSGLLQSNSGEYSWLDSTKKSNESSKYYTRFTNYLSIDTVMPVGFVPSVNPLTLSGLSVGDYTYIRNVPLVIQHSMSPVEIDTMRWYQGGFHSNDFTIKGGEKTSMDIICPIVSGRLDTELEVDFRSNEWVQLYLINKEGYVVSHTIVDETDTFEKNKSFKAAQLGIYDLFYAKHKNDYKYYAPVTLFGVGKGEYYIAALYASDKFKMHWYGADSPSTLKDMSLIYNTPLKSLDIPQGAKTISFETDSTWIKDFNWDITPVTNIKSVTQTQFQVQQIGQKLQLQLPKEMKNATVKIFTSSGRLVKKGQFENGGIHRLDVSKLSKGMYLLKIDGKNLNFSKKVSIR